MSVEPFERLHGALQYHIVNSMGWKGLRSTQADAVAPILEGKHCLILAPTAGGKTEAASIPILSRMATEQWPGPSVLYVCPIKALLNNLESRLSRYAGFVGRTVQVWHGDIGQGAKARARRSAPDILLTTPESLEGMLISTKVDRATWFGDVRAVIVDELHSFAGDDRGWHLRAVIKRIEAYAKEPIQRIGLSATVGNPAELLDWFAGTGERQVIGSSSISTDADVTIDHVGTLANAATVISRLHRGSKRLIFCDSRSKVEELAVALRSLNTRTFVSHSSLSASERKLAETAFAEEQDCAIVSTSTLELGIDVGDLDYVIQIDSPSTVSSFLQRMGRTGRRHGSRRNCLFLTTTDEAFLLACAITTLWREEYVEHIKPPPMPWHIVAQQMMAIVLERPGHPSREVMDIVRKQFPELDGATISTVFEFMASKGILFDNVGLASMGVKGEELFGRAHFLDLLSSFASPMVLAARHGSTELGYVDPTAVQRPKEGPAVLLLGGRSWKVVSVDWPKRTVWVEPTSEKGKTRWLGTSRWLSFDVCQAMRRTLQNGDESKLTLSKRAVRELDEVRELIGAPECQGSVLVEHLPSGRVRWWTFAGGAVNSTLALRVGGQERILVDDLWVETDPGFTLGTALGAQLNPNSAPDLAAAGPRDHELKFSACLPAGLITSTIISRTLDDENLERLSAKV
ncbi:ATP-dependent RNA helicase DbpA [Paraburkholderia aspalathi]|uniref:ATP-dependent RNA helicase DbpA n=1 Tax=Paraburkholderia aspalathi TaxID=1324617 RepID=A0ABM8SMW4_9BURK|nr:DEAD/DEAH box helicase [Paraburkholderia aspalathi]MBK3822149.1 DEAD/DEAH box helicase [Paraburkholderia aspalathi]MBK3833983.1 DEAD/DEAH box helicase [Paraburkholderia aspalathi]MBK3863722.1 DEAD/DEAH box helicase [Paraburkholderia aspalathi]CAE6821096.1 ATP-dependent RNA helicase DbpA [Paraburkholderia aspalathi]